MQKKALFLVLLVSVSIASYGQNAMFKALFMFNFGKYIEWPGQTSGNQFIIGVYGNDDIIPELNKLAAARKINNKTIVIKSVNSPSEVKDANIFFVPENKQGKLNEVIAYFNDKPTLIIGESNNACHHGAGINYIMQDGKMKYEICKTNITSHNLNLDHKLVALGIEID